MEFVWAIPWAFAYWGALMLIVKLISPKNKGDAVEPTIGRIVYYRLTREDAQAANRRRVDGANHYREHRENANGVQVHVGTQCVAGDIVPLLVVRVWPDEYDVGQSICRDHLPDTEPTWSFPMSGHGVSGQAFLDGNDSLWITSAPQGDFNGAWDWPVRV